MDTSKTSFGRTDPVWPPWLEPVSFKTSSPAPSHDFAGHLPHHNLGGGGWGVGGGGVFFFLTHLQSGNFLRSPPVPRPPWRDPVSFNPRSPRPSRGCGGPRPRGGGGGGGMRSGVGWCFFLSHTPAVVQFPSLSSGSSTPVSFRHVALALTSSPPSSSPSSLSPRLIWAALAGLLTRMALIGEEQCVETC